MALTHQSVYASQIVFALEVLYQTGIRNKYKQTKKVQSILFSNIVKITLNKYNQTDQQWSWGCKYIDVILNQRLSFKESIGTARNKCRAAVNKIYRLIARNKFYLLNINCSCNTSVLFAILIYYYQIWSFTDKKIHTQPHNSTIRLIYNILIKELNVLHYIIFFST